MMNNETLNEVFEIDSAPSKGEVVAQLNPADEKPETTQEDHDFDEIRHNLFDLILVTQQALNDAMEVAKSSEAPRAYEVVSNMIGQAAELNKSVLEIHERKQKLKGKIQPDNPAQSITNNAVFVGTTAELNNLILSKLK